MRSKTVVNASIPTLLEGKSGGVPTLQRTEIGSVSQILSQKRQP